MKARQDKKGRWIADMRINRVGPQILCADQLEAQEMVAKAVLERAAKRGVDETVTVADAVESYIENRRMNEYGRRTVANYKTLLNLHVVPRLPPLLADIDEKVLISIRDNPPSSVCPEWADEPFMQLGCMLNNAWASNAIVSNPIDKLPQVRRRDRYNRDRTHVRLRMVAEEELKLCLSRSTGRMHVMISLAIHAGLRLGEILALQWRSIDWIRRRIRVSKTWRLSEAVAKRQGVATRSSHRLVPISKQLLKALEAYLRETRGRKGDYLFTGESGAQLSTGRASVLLHRFLISIGIHQTDPATGRLRGPFAWHAFRHACVSRWIHANVELSRIMRWIGHRHSCTTLDIYAYELRQRSLSTTLN